MGDSSINVIESSDSVDIDSHFINLNDLDLSNIGIRTASLTDPDEIGLEQMDNESINGEYVGSVEEIENLERVDDSKHEDRGKVSVVKRHRDRTVCRIDERITSEASPYDIIEVLQVIGKEPMGRLNLAAAPGKKDRKWNRNLELDLSIMKKQGIDIIICLLEWGEMFNLKLIDYPKKAQEAGFIFYHLPIKDMNIPRFKEINALVPIIVDFIATGHNVLIHCRSGYGRAGTICACCLAHFGFDGSTAINQVRIRRPGAIQTELQEECVTDYCKWLDPISFIFN